MRATLCRRCAPVGVEVLTVGVRNGVCEGCGCKGSSPELSCYSAAGVSSWTTVRRAFGVMKGEPADAVLDCDALHDDAAPASFVPTPLPADLFPSYLVCSDQMRQALGGALTLEDIHLSEAEAVAFCEALQVKREPAAELVRLFADRHARRKPTGP